MKSIKSVKFIKTANGYAKLDSVTNFEISSDVIIDRESKNVRDTGKWRVVVWGDGFRDILTICDSREAAKEWLDKYMSNLEAES